jgi:hypothetical protein
MDVPDAPNEPLPLIRILVVAAIVLAIVFLAGMALGNWRHRNDRCETLENEYRNAVAINNTDAARFLKDMADGACGRGARQ